MIDLKNVFQLYKCLICVYMVDLQSLNLLTRGHQSVSLIMEWSYLAGLVFYQHVKMLHVQCTIICAMLKNVHGHYFLQKMYSLGWICRPLTPWHQRCHVPIFSPNIIAQRKEYHNFSKKCGQKGFKKVLRIVDVIYGCHPVEVSKQIKKFSKNLTAQPGN